MSSGPTVYSQAASRYAKALHQVSSEKDSVPKVLDALRALDKAVLALGDEFLEAASPVVSDADKQKIFVDGLKNQNLPEEVLSLLGLLVEKKRLALLPEIALAFQDYSDQLNGVARGTVESTTNLGPEERSRIEELISKVTKKKAILEYKTSPGLIGGLIARVGGYTFDDSLDTQLTLLSEYLKRRSH
jgi:F-type H+-transporting ATPase subunit delta